MTRGVGSGGAGQVIYNDMPCAADSADPTTTIEEGLRDGGQGEVQADPCARVLPTGSTLFRCLCGQPETLCKVAGATTSPELACKTTAEREYIKETRYRK